MMKTLILASTSPYRKRLLERLGLPFSCLAPGIDEQAKAGETPASLAERLADEKARAVAKLHPEATVIGSDQVASLQGQLLGKPGNHERARAQLKACSGNTVVFHTAIAMLAPNLALHHVEPFSVSFRQLSDTAIEHYLLRDRPYDCAGSFKWESLGIALFERLSGDDPTSLEGLPLIALTKMLERAGHPVLA